jgi:hypothetical protein
LGVKAETAEGVSSEVICQGRFRERTRNPERLGEIGDFRKIEWNPIAFRPIWGFNQWIGKYEIDGTIHAIFFPPVRKPIVELPAKTDAARRAWELQLRLSSKKSSVSAVSAVSKGKIHVRTVPWARLGASVGIQFHTATVRNDVNRSLWQRLEQVE